MKTIFKVFALIVLFVSIVSCTDESKFNNEAFFNLEEGAHARFSDIHTDFLIAGDTPTDAVFSAEIWDVNENLQGLEIYLIADGDDDDVELDTLLLDTHTSFPSIFSVTGEDIQSLTGKEVGFAQTFNFISVAIRNDGTRFTTASLDTGIANGTYDGTTRDDLYGSNTGYASTFEFSLFLNCSFDFDSIQEGTYVKTGDSLLGQTGNILEVVKGPNENEITLIGLIFPGYDIVMSFTEEGEPIIEEQLGWEHSFFQGLQLSTTTGSVVVSCENTFILNLQHRSPLGNVFPQRLSFTLLE